MRRVTTQLSVWLLVGAVSAGCASDRRGATVAGGPGESRLPSPATALAVAVPRDPWVLPSRVGGPLEPLRRDIAAASPAGAPRLSLVVGPSVANRLGVDDRALDALTPALGLVFERGGLELTRGFEDPFVRPWPLDDDQRPELRDGVVLPSSPTLYLVAARLETRRWRARPAEVSGSCGPVLAALGHAQMLALAQLRPLVTTVDARLERRFVARLEPEVESVQSRMGREARAAGEEGARSCAAQIDTLRAAVRSCLDGSECALAPRLRLSTSLFVGVPPAPDACAELVTPIGESSRSMVRQAQAMAAAEVVTSIDPGWAEMADRSAALVAVHEHVARLCEPRRRRFSVEDLHRLDQEARRLLGLVGGPRLDSNPRWDDQPTVFHLAGRGKLVALQTAHSAPAEAIRRGAARLETEVYARARCTGPFEEDPLAVVLVVDGEVRASHFVYPEQLYCDELE